MMNSKVDEYVNKAEKWQDEIKKLREIILSSGLVEEYKWNQPSYTFDNSVLVMIAPFKSNCAISFFKGALLKDTYNILVKPGENSQSARLIKFTDVQQIIDVEHIIKEYISEAIEAEKQGLKIDFKDKKELVIPDELEDIMKEMPALKQAFESLTPGRQRAYILYFSAPKHSKTKVARIEKYIDHILDGKGMHD